MSQINNITKTTAVTSKQSKIGVDDLGVNVGLPKIKGQKLDSIEDSKQEDSASYYENQQQRPANRKGISSENSTSNENRVIASS